MSLVIRVKLNLMRMRGLFLTAVVFFSIVTSCHAQDTAAETQALTPGERLRQVEETLRVFHTHPRKIDLLRKLEAELKEILASDSSSTFKSQVEANLDVVHENLAYHDLQIAMFYMDQKRSLRGATSRLLTITQRYPKFSKMDEVLFRLSVLSQDAEQEDQAVRYCWTLICNYPHSQYMNAAFNQLHKIGVSSWEGCQKFELIHQSGKSQALPD